MGNFNTNKYQVNNSSMSSKKSHSFFNSLGCSVLVKKGKKTKYEERFKSKSLSFDESETIKNNTILMHQKYISDGNKIESKEQIYKNSINSSNSFDNLNDKNLKNGETNSKNETIISAIKSPESLNKISTNFCLQSEIYENSSKDPILRSYPRLSESSLNSDDLMLNTDVNLDQADDDVSKDYNTSEKDDPFIYENDNIIKKEYAKTVNTSKSIFSSSIDAIADESERNDIVSFNSSRESSASIQRKILGKGFSLRPHSFSSPLQPNSRKSKPFSKRNSNLSTVDSVDLAWTWISTSETANLSQDVSNLKLMLLKMKRLLLDETYNDGLMSSSRIDASFNVTSISNVFSEPSTPNCNNTILNSSLVDPNLLQNRQWETMTKEMLIQELYDLHQQNGDLQYQLKEKSRIIEFLQDQQQNYRNYPRLHSNSSKSVNSNRRVIRSSTFETASTLDNQTFSQDSEFSFSSSQDTKVSQPEPIQLQC